MRFDEISATAGTDMTIAVIDTGIDDEIAHSAVLARGIGTDKSLR